MLTSSIETKIKQFAKTHPEASKQASLATSLLPRLPLSDENYKVAKREVSRRAAEFDSLEDVFQSKDNAASSVIPDILKEHFRRNSESSLEEEDEEQRVQRQIVNGEQTLPRMHRDVREAEMEVGEEDYDVLFH